MLRLCPQLVPAVTEHLAGGGKFVRAGLVLTSAAAAGAEDGAGVVGGVAIELVHNFSLVHDDIIDGDLERRHRPTVWAAHGVGHAIIAGDALATLAFQILLEEPTPERVRAAGRLAEATQAMIAGQAEDMASELLVSLSVEECLQMGAGKTGALLSCAAAMGAILAGAPAAERRGTGRVRPPPRHRLPGNRRCARRLGRAGCDGQGGRQRPAPAQKDAPESRSRLPTVATLPTALERLLERDLGEAEVDKATRLLEQCGAREETMAIGESQLAPPWFTRTSSPRARAQGGAGCHRPLCDRA